MGVTYGIPITSTEDRYITIAEKALGGMAKAASPGAYLVDLIPISEFLLPFVFFCQPCRLMRFLEFSEICAVRFLRTAC